MPDQSELNLNLPNAEASTTVDGYQFEPIKGYPMLQWKGKRPFMSTQYYPAQLKEVHGTEVDGWRSKIYWGDNLQVMSHLLKEYRGRVRLVYLDPPFDSKADYRKRIQLKGATAVNDSNAFEEKQYTDIWSNDEYLQFMYERLTLTRELMAENSNIYLHCDLHKNHLLRCLLDEIFGAGDFFNEIIWKRTTAHSSSNKFAPVHDTIFYYTKTENSIWNGSRTGYEQEYLDKYYRFDDGDGRLYWRDNLCAAGIRKGSSGSPWRGIDPAAKGMHWKYSIERLEELDKQGRIYWPERGTMPQYKRYRDELKGKAVPDIWDDVDRINPVGSERLGYPTQKPEALLERIIKASSNPGDIVFDCFMGSGTTQAVAMKLGRRFIGADINLGAVQITTKRLLAVAEELKQSTKAVQLPIQSAVPALRAIPGGKEQEAGRTKRAAEAGGSYGTVEDEEIEENPAEPTTFYTGFEVYNVNHYEIFRNPLEAKDLLLEALEVNRLEQGKLFDGEKDGRMVKIMPVNRIATRADLNELIAGFDYKAFEKRYQEHPHAAVEKITLVCMGHESDLAAQLKREVKPFELDVEVVDILRDKQDIQFKRDSEARIVIQGSELVIEAFYPMNLLGKLSLQQENVEDWRELVESVMIDWNYDSAIFQPLQVDIPGKNELVSGRYLIPDDAGTIRVKITDLLSESLEVEVEHG